MAEKLLSGRWNERLRVEKVLNVRLAMRKDFGFSDRRGKQRKIVRGWRRRLINSIQQKSFEGEMEWG